MKYLLAALLLAASLAHATTPRGDKAPADFRKLAPCPGTGLTTGACDGWVMDHICPLECNCPDSPTNLQWQSKSEALAKDRWEGQCWRYNRSLMNPLPPALMLQPPMKKGE